MMPHAALLREAHRYPVLCLDGSVPGWKVATGRPIPAEDSDDVTIASLVLFAATSAAIAAVAQRYAYKGSQKWLAPKLEARFGVPQLEA